MFLNTSKMIEKLQILSPYPRSVQTELLRRALGIYSVRSDRSCYNMSERITLQFKNPPVVPVAFRVKVRDVPVTCQSRLASLNESPHLAVQTLPLPAAAYRKRSSSAGSCELSGAGQGSGPLHCGVVLPSRKCVLAQPKLLFPPRDNRASSLHSGQSQRGTGHEAQSQSPDQ